MSKYYLYTQLKLLSVARDFGLAANGKVTQYNLDKGREVLDALIAEEIIDELRNRWQSHQTNRQRS